MTSTLVRMDPIREVAAMHNELSRFMNGLLESNGQTKQSWIPVVDVWETDRELVYAFDLPGIPENTISVEFQEGALTVSAERELPKAIAKDSFQRFERRYGSFARTIGLPEGVTENSVTARYRDGVLELHVAKPKQVKPRRIQVEAAKPGSKSS